MEMLQKVLASVLAWATSWIIGATDPAVLSQVALSPAPAKDNFVWFLVDNTDRLRLVSNYDKKLAFRELIVKQGCEMAVNGGFYDTDSRPLGLVVSEDR
ncbi:MAG: hypothetical protein AAB909_02455, partial [Patescibacteria group bacterium]